jgi:hypothetical protein
MPLKPADHPVLSLLMQMVGHSPLDRVEGEEQEAAAEKYAWSLRLLGKWLTNIVNKDNLSKIKLQSTTVHLLTENNFFAI